jgi:hypothetical protein
VGQEPPGRLHRQAIPGPDEGGRLPHRGAHPLLRGHRPAGRMHGPAKARATPTSPARRGSSSCWSRCATSWRRRT